MFLYVMFLAQNVLEMKLKIPLSNTKQPSTSFIMAADLFILLHVC